MTESERKRRDLILTIQKMHQDGDSIHEIARITGKERKTVKKYLEGEPDLLCKSNKRSLLVIHTEFIIRSIKEGRTASSIAKQLKEEGAKYTLSNIRAYVTRLAKEHGLKMAKYSRTSVQHDQEGNDQPKKKYITRKGIFNHIWMKSEIDSESREYLWKNNDILPEIDRCVREFRDIFIEKSIPRLHLFIWRYCQSKVKEIASFARGLSKDIDAVENAVSSPLSNGFVEGTNSKVKTIKKAMYGRCGKPLLEAKLMYEKQAHY